MNAADLIRRALISSGAVTLTQTIYAEDLYLGLATLNAMLAQWQSRRWLVPSLAEMVVPATGAQSYTVGTGGDIDMLRPDKIDDAFVRLTGQPGSPVDYPMAVMTSREDYNQISLKALNSWPAAVYYSPGSPLGTLFVWPVAGTQYELHLFCKAVLGNFATLASSLFLPAEYEEAILYNLSMRLSGAYGTAPQPMVAALARAGLETIRAANAQLAELRMPPGILHGRNAGGWAGGVPSFSPVVVKP